MLLRRPLPRLVLTAACSLALIGDATAAPAPLNTGVTSHPANPTPATTATFAFDSHSTVTTCSLDGSSYSPCVSGVRYTGLHAGTHTFAVRAGSGPLLKVSSYSWMVDTTVPTTPSGLSAVSQGGPIQLAWRAASDPDSSVAYAVYRDGSRIAMTSSTSYVDASVAPAASYRYAVAAYDPAENTSATSAAVSVGTPTPQPLGVSGTWSLKFDDEFSGTSIDLTKWQPNWRAASNTTITPPDNRADLNCDDPGQVTEGAGVLRITAVARRCLASNGQTYSFSSGLINSYNSYRFAYGYAEARIYVPSAQSGAPANFPAFWATGTGSWPATGELDVMEVLSRCGPGEGFHFHSTLGTFGGCASLPSSTGWHTFGADWQPGVVTFYYDGLRVGQVTSGVTGAPMYLILNNSVDPTYGGPSTTPADLQVDYVRIWQ